MPTITAVSFDCHGTLIDWEGGLGTFLYQLARRHNDYDPGPGRQLRERWEEIQREVVAAGYKHYRDVLHESLSHWVGERGYRWNTLEGEALEQAMESWQPFAEAVPVVQRAKEAGLKVAIISNADRDLMERTLRHLEVDFDECVHAEDCKAFKPSPHLFDSCRDRLGVPPEQMLHVSSSLDEDIRPAREQGYRTAWVNRRGAPLPEGVEPDHEWRDLWALAELIEKQG